MCAALTFAFGVLTQVHAGTLPDISGTWHPNGNRAIRAHISQSGTSVSLNNGQGATATGTFVDPSTLRTNWGTFNGGHITGTISNDLRRIDWSNGTYWSRPALTPIVPNPTPRPITPNWVGNQLVCKGSAPSGWVVTSDSWDPTRCGAPTKIVYNVWRIAELQSVPVGGTLTICLDYVPIPHNWTVVSSTWSPTKCGQPVKIINNVATIKREY